MTERHLFSEFDLTRENVLKWAEDEVLKEPIIKIKTKETPNSVERVLQEVMGKHYAQNLNEYKKSELLEECLSYIMNGVQKPCCDMTVDELLDGITGELFENWEFETMDDLIQWIESDW